MDLNIELLPWQQKVWDDPSRFRVVAAGRRTGKSRLAAYLLLVQALQTDRGDIFYVAPTQQQARDIMWSSLLEIGSQVITGSHVNNMQIQLANGSKISLKGSDRPETLRGRSIAFLVLDEYADMKPETWELVLRPALTDLKGRALFIGTPVGRNHFYDLYIQAGREDQVDYESFHFTSYDNPILEKSEIDSAKKSMSSFAFRQEFMASFEAKGSEMFKEEWIEFDEEEPEGDYYIAIDPAGFNESGQSRRKSKNLDSTAIAVVKVNRSGWWIKTIISGRWELKETAKKIFDAVEKYRPVSVGIERGIARQAIMSPLTDMMRKTHRYFRCVELTHGNKNKTDRIMWALQGRFENGAIKLNEGDWNDKFLDELYQFPDPLTHDDTVDALAYIDQLAQVAYASDYEEPEHEYAEILVGY